MKAGPPGEKPVHSPSPISNIIPAGADPMRIPRLTWTFRRLMIVVAAIGLVIGVTTLALRCARYRKLALKHEILQILSLLGLWQVRQKVLLQVLIERRVGWHRACFLHGSILAGEPHWDTNEQSLRTEAAGSSSG